MEGTQEPLQGCRSPSRDGAAPAGLQPGFQQLCYKAERCSQGAEPGALYVCSPDRSAVAIPAAWDPLGCHQAGEVRTPWSEGL